jgi:hypothetical protein
MTRAHERPVSERDKHPERESPTRTPSPLYAAAGPAFDAFGNRALLRLLRSGRLQRKTRMTEPGDPLEHEADRAANAVVAEKDLKPATTPPPTEDEKLATALGLGSKQTPDIVEPDIVEPNIDVAGMPELYGGYALNESTRGLMESRFGESFSDVRIHTGYRASEAADELRSRAFTVGENIVFAEGEFAPETSEGMRLLAHELAHVVQQRRPTGAMATDREAERDARDAAYEVASGGTPAVRERAVPGTVQKQPEGSGMPKHRIEGTSIIVDDIWMAYIMGGQGLLEEGKGWNPSTRTFSLKISVLGRNYKLERFPEAEGKARQRHLMVELTSRNRFNGSTHTITIGAPAKPSAKPLEKPTAPQPPGLPPDEPIEEPKQETKLEEPVKTKEPAGGQVKKVEQQSASDPQGALKEAGSLTQGDLTSLGPEPRKALLNAAAGASPVSSPPQLAHDLITTTPDRDAGELSGTLHADGGKMLDDLKRNAPDADSARALDQAVGDLDARRMGAPPPKTGKDFVDWTPEMEKKANEVREAMKKIGRRTPTLTENMEGRPEWDRIKQWQDDDLQREMRNLNREVARWDEEHAARGDVAAGIGAAANEEVKKALERVRTAKTITELFEARKQAKLALWRANQAMDAKRDLDRFENSVKAWNETQGGWATLASAPSHALAGVSSDRPDQIAAEARSEVNRALVQLREAKTPDEMARAATLLKYTIANANLQLSWHQEQVYGGAEKTIVGIKVVAVTSAAIVAPQYVIPGIIIGGGLGAARQGVQIAEGSRKEFSGMEVLDNAVIGGFTAPFAVGIPVVGYGLVGSGLVSGVSELSEGHTWTGAFDLTTALLPFAAKGVSGKGPGFPTGRWVRTRTGALMLRVSVAVEDVPGLGGRSPTVSIPYEPSIGSVTEGQPALHALGGGQRTGPVSPQAPVPGPQPSPQLPGIWQTAPAANAPLQPYGYPVVIRLQNPIVVLTPQAGASAGPLADVESMAAAYGQQAPTIRMFGSAPGTQIVQIGESRPYWQQGSRAGRGAQWLPLIVEGEQVLSPSVRGTEAEHPHATAGVKALLPSWGREASPSIVLAEPQSRIKTPIDNALTQALKDGRITPEQWLAQSRANIYRSWFEARAQGIPVPTAEELAAAILRQEAVMRARGVSGF